MAEGDQVRGPLRRKDAGGAGHAEDVTFGQLACFDGGEGGALHPEHHMGDGRAGGLRLGGDVHHAGFALGGEVGEPLERGLSPRRPGTHWVRRARRRDQAGAWEEWVWLAWRMMVSIRSLAISFSFLTSLTRHC